MKLIDGNSLVVRCRNRRGVITVLEQKAWESALGRLCPYDVRLRDADHWSNAGQDSPPQHADRAFAYVDFAGRIRNSRREGRRAMYDG